MDGLAMPVELGRVIQEHFGALEADFQRYYHLDFRKALWGEKPLGARRLWSFIRWLPPESAFSRSMSPDGWSWSTTEELLATLVEAVDASNRLFIQAHTDKKTKVPDAVKIPRPYDLVAKTRERRLATQEEQKAFFEDVEVVG